MLDEPVNGLAEGAAVDFRGIEIGAVLEVSIEFDQASTRFRAPVLVETYPGRLGRMGPRVEETHAEGIKRLAAAGLRARLGSRERRRRSLGCRSLSPPGCRADRFRPLRW